MDKLLSLYIDVPFDSYTPDKDDFLVAIGKTKSNSVYHIASSREGRTKNRMKRYYLKCYKSDLITALRREKNQKIIPIIWYKR